MRILVAGDHPGRTERIRETLAASRVDLCACLLPAALDHVETWRPEAVLVLLPDALEPALAEIQQLHAAAPGRVLGIGPAARAEAVLRVLRAGASEYLEEESISSQLSASLRRLSDEAPALPPLGRTITVLGAGGGTGASTLAVNIASTLCREGKPSLLVDLQPGSADLATLLDLQPPYNLADFCDHIGRMDTSMFRKCLVAHAGGVQLLAAPANHRDLRRVTVPGVRFALHLARTTFPYVIVDLARSDEELFAQGLRQTDVVVLVMRLDFTSLRQALRILEFLQEHHLPTTSVRLVVNRYRRQRELRIADVERALKLPAAHVIPEDFARVGRANNRGMPVVLEAPRRKVSRLLAQLARGVNGRLATHTEVA
jgi:pilus assembly protein CpaE